jgi:hypothetical protein
LVWKQLERELREKSDELPPKDRNILLRKSFIGVRATADFRQRYLMLIF